MDKPEMTIHLKPNDIKEAIRLYVQQELGMFTSYDDITINVGMHFEDRSEHSYPILEGADVKTQPKGD